MCSRIGVSGFEICADADAPALAGPESASVGAMAWWAHARAEARGHGGAGRSVGRAEEVHQVFHTC